MGQPRISSRYYGPNSDPYKAFYLARTAVGFGVRTVAERSTTSAAHNGSINKTANKASGRPTYLHNVVVDFRSHAFHDAKVSLEIPPAGVAVRDGVVRGPVEEDANAGVVLHQVVGDQSTGRHSEEGRNRDSTLLCRDHKPPGDELYFIRLSWSRNLGKVEHSVGVLVALPCVKIVRRGHASVQTDIFFSDTSWHS